MASRKPAIGIVGCFQNGKSTLVNCLLDDKVAMTGDGTATTRRSSLFTWGHIQEVSAVSSQDTRHAVPFHDYIAGENLPDIDLSHFEVSLWKPLLQHVCVIDTPGFGDSDDDNDTAERSLGGVDFVIFVSRNKPLNQAEKSILKNICERKLPFAVLVNCTEKTRGFWDPVSDANRRICDQIEGSLKEVGNCPYPINGRYVWPVNLAWFWYATQHMHGDDLSEAEEDLLGDIERFMTKMELPEARFSALADKSNFIPFRETIQRIAVHHGYLNSEEGRRALDYIEIAELGLSEEDFESAMIAAERACYVAPGFKPSLRCRAEVCLIREEYDEAVSSASLELEIDERDVDALFVRAKAFFFQKVYDRAKVDLARIMDLLESEWHILWEEEDKALKALKLTEAYLMKVECEQRAGDTDAALTALRQMIFCDQKPLDSLSDNELCFTVRVLHASLELKASNYGPCLESAGKASQILEKAPLINPPDCLNSLLELFEVEPVLDLENRVKKIVLEACLALNRDDLERVTKDVTLRTNLLLEPLLWANIPKAVPYYISYRGRGNDSFDPEPYVQFYFDKTSDVNLAQFLTISKRELSATVLKRLEYATKLRCEVGINMILMMNSIELTNTGNPTLSEVKVSYYYKENGFGVTKTVKLPSNAVLARNKSYKWTEVFPGKAVFGGNKITDPVITSVSSAQGAGVEFS